MTKNILVFLAAFYLSFTTVVAQDYTTTDKKAIKSFDNAMNAFDARNYQLAIDLIGEAIEEDKNFIEAYLLRFEVCAEMRDNECAEASLEEAIAINKDFFPNAYFFLGALKFNRGEYGGAQTAFEKFLTYPIRNQDMVDLANRQIRNCEFAKKQLKNPVDFNPVNLGPSINSEAPEYYPTLTADDNSLIFTRLVNDHESYTGKNEDFYISAKLNERWQSAQPLYGINSPFNEGAPTISGDGRILVFTGCEIMGDYGKGRKGFGSCDLFIAYKEGVKWSAPENLGSIVNTSAWESQPSISADGNTIYFVRGYPNRNGEREQDIYFMIRQKDGNWSDAIKLPKNINTKYREESVLIHPDGRTLYFSSNGHVGMGGLDIYKTEKLDDGTWKDPVNLGYPINTFKDENSLLVSANGKLAYFASDRSGGMGDLDLYQFELPEEVRPTPVTYAKGRVVDVENRRPVKANLKLNNVSSRSKVFELQSDPITGEFLIALPSGNTYALSAVSEGYLYHSETFDLAEGDGNEPYVLDILMKKVKEGNAVVLQNIFFDLDKSELKIESKPELDELVAFLKANPSVQVEISGHTDSQGSEEYNRELSKARAESVKKYLSEQGGISADRITTKGYGASQPIASNDTEEGRAKNRRTEFKILGVK